MDTTKSSALAAEIASHLRASRDELTERWLERIAARVNVPADRIFPSEELLDHVPVLMDGIADYLEDPTEEITADVPVVAKAMELGELRFRQGFDASQILKEYEILGGLLFTFSARVVAESDRACSPDDLLTCSHRIFSAISVVEQVTTAHYLRALGERMAEREERLRRFNRMITHELKNRVGATLGAGQLLREDWLGSEERQRFAGMVEENAQAIQKVLENLSALAKIDGQRRRHRNVGLQEVVTEVFRQLRELARAREVDLRVGGELPDIEVNAAAVELCLSNYLSNAIKYSNPTAAERWAEVTAALESVSGESPGTQLIVRVRDNGLGVPVEAREQLFDRFFRAHTDVVETEGTGLGLNLVQETASSLGGAAWAEFDAEAGSVFAFSLPLSPEEEGAAAGAEAVSGSPGAERSSGARPTDAAPAKASD
ncbi:MAG TPA: ATP-binding protein [Longimicrobiales bacterium]|nr:ATP-binding protein [Longimicrobiales bacterium]